MYYIDIDYCIDCGCRLLLVRKRSRCQEHQVHDVREYIQGEWMWPIPYASTLGISVLNQRPSSLPPSPSSPEIFVASSAFETAFAEEPQGRREAPRRVRDWRGASRNGPRRVDEVDNTTTTTRKVSTRPDKYCHKNYDQVVAVESLTKFLVLMYCCAARKQSQMARAPRALTNSHAYSLSLSLP